MTTALVPLPSEGEMSGLRMLGEALAKSRYFKEASDPARAMVKVLYGRELGLGAVQSLLGIDFQEKSGSLSLRAHTIAALIKSSKRYDYRVTKGPGTDGCEVTFYEVSWKQSPEGPEKVLTEIGKSFFGPADAQRAGLNTKSTYMQHPGDMYYNRAMAKGARWFCPDVFGAPVYVEGEIPGAFADAADEATRIPPIIELEPGKSLDTHTGEIIEAQAVVRTDPAPTPNESLKATIEALGTTPERLPEALRPDSDADLLAAELPPGTQQERIVAAQIIEESQKIADAKVASVVDRDLLNCMGDIVPVELAKRILGQPSGSELQRDDANDFNAYLAEFLGGGEKGRKAAKEAWSKAGVVVKKGAAVTREQAIEVARSTNPNPN